MSSSATATEQCESPHDEAPQSLLLNPFNRHSAHHHPIGSEAHYASTDDPATLSWLSGSTLAINVGAPWGVSVGQTDSSDSLMMVKAKAVGQARISGLPVKLRLPRNGFETKIATGNLGNTDGVVVLYDYESGQVAQLRQYNWNNGSPTAGQYRRWDIKGLGHGTEIGDRVGTSASGVAALFGLLRGFEMNAPGRPIQHALQVGLPGKHIAGRTCNIMLSRDIVLPATSRDGSALSEANNTGSIPYGALLALPPNVDLVGLGLSEPGLRLAEAIRDYGIYVVDTAGCENGAIRADQFISDEVLTQLRTDIPKIYPYIRMITNNNALENDVAGGGRARAPNCAFDAHL